ncbi:MAG: CRISPR system precrRNA processing endoribonuclease RAMP protein Cas6 [Anaerolineae bacterium]|nr:CRISPR system precrRNA processing endoribonuclease RAMP protein Cas6 [Anaerolineae bacterium]
MEHFTAHRLRFVAEAQDIVELNEHQGSAIRGALFHALRHKFCAFARQPDAECSGCVLAATCPVALLVSTLDPNHTRGQDRPRPFTVQPPILNGEWRTENEKESSQFSVHHPSGHFIEHDSDQGYWQYEPRETLSFGLTLYAQAMQLFPYVVLALQAFEEGGIGRKCEQYDGRWRRGRLAVREVWAENPLSTERQAVLRQGSRQVQVPDVPVTHAQVMANGERRIADDESPIVHSLSFLTPTRLVEKGHLLRPELFRFRPFFQRLLERLESLSEVFCDTPLAVAFPALLAAAEDVRVVENRLHWEEVRSYSTRRHAESPLGGLVGHVTLQAKDWSPFMPWLIWGQFTHVGKDAVKGNGMYRME